MPRLLFFAVVCCALLAAQAGCRGAAPLTAGAVPDSTVAAMLPEAYAGLYQLDGFGSGLEHGSGSSFAGRTGVTMRLRRDRFPNLEGHTGVNRFSGQVWIGDEGRVYRLSLTDVGQAESQPGRMETERLFLSALRRVFRFGFDADGLFYGYDAQDRPLLRFHRLRR